MTNYSKLKFLVSYLSIFIFLSSPLFSDFKALDERIEKTATAYGYKFSNLRELEFVTQAFNKIRAPSTEHVEGTKKRELRPVRIPEFFGISSKDIKQILRDHGFDITQKWRDVLDSMSASDKETAMRTKAFPTSF